LPNLHCWIGLQHNLRKTSSIIGSRKREKYLIYTLEKIIIIINILLSGKKPEFATDMDFP
jgi:hypothetical protein